MKEVCVLLSFLVVILAILLKFVVTELNFTKIEDSIFKYHLTQMVEGTYDPDECLYKYEKSVVKVFLNSFDWGYKHILPPDKYELVKPYLENEEVKEGKKNA